MEKSVDTNYSSTYRERNIDLLSLTEFLTCIITVLLIVLLLSLGARAAVIVRGVDHVITVRLAALLLSQAAISILGCSLLLLLLLLQHLLLFQNSLLETEHSCSLLVLVLGPSLEDAARIGGIVVGLWSVCVCRDKV